MNNGIYVRTYIRLTMHLNAWAKGWCVYVECVSVYVGTSSFNGVYGCVGS